MIFIFRNPAVNNSSWEPLTKNPEGSFRCLYINSAQTQEMGELSKDKAVEFWRNLLPSEHPPDFVDPNIGLKQEL